MSYEELLAPTGVYVTTFVVALLSAILPVVSSEACLFLAALASPQALLPLVLLASAGEMLGKGALYLAGTGAVRLPLRPDDARLQRLRVRLEARKARCAGLIFMSAFASFPPFYLLSVLAGALRFNPVTFGVCGFVGRALRFGLVVLGPQLIRSFLP